MVQMRSEDRKKQYRKIYELLWETPRTTKTTISETLGVTRGTVERRMSTAFGKDYIVGPEIRKRSFKNLREYMYFIRCEDPDRAYLSYREDPNVIYHAQIGGFCNLWIISKKKMDIDGEIIVEGYRSDYHVSYAPDHSFQKAIKNMKQKTEHFSPNRYRLNEKIENHLDEKIGWDEEDEAMYEYFKYNLRKKLSPIFEKYQIHSNRVYKWLQEFPKSCSVFTAYYPKTFSAYDSYLFMFETNYEDFIIDLFSELPTTTTFFKVSNVLFTYAHMAKFFVREGDANSPTRLHIPPLMMKLIDKGIVKRKGHAIAEYFMRRDI